MPSPSRRTLLSAGLGTGLAGLLPLRHLHAAAPLKVGFVFLGPVGDTGWTYQHDLGRRELEKNLGAQVSVRAVPETNEGPDSERVARELSAEGCKLVFGASFGYMKPMLSVANDFPDTRYLIASGYQTAAFVDSGPRGLVGAERGFDRGFERYVHTQDGSEERFRYDMRHTVDAGVAWLAERDPQRPFFLFLHTKSVHSSADGQTRESDAPYDKPEPYRTRFLPPGGQRFSWRPDPPADVGWPKNGDVMTPL